MRSKESAVVLSSDNEHTMSAGGGAMGIATDSFQLPPSIRYSSVILADCSMEIHFAAGEEQEVVFGRGRQMFF